MKVASGQASGRRAEPALAEAAVRSALANAGLSRANQVVLFLSQDFSRQAQAAVVAAARAAECLQVSGCTTHGLFTEHGWQLDQPAAAALVIATEPSASQLVEGPIISFSQHHNLPFEWSSGPARAGLIHADAAAWSHGHLAEHGCTEIFLPGRCRQLSVSLGLRPLGPAQTVEQCDGYELRRISGHSAVDHLRRSLPPEFRERLPVHRISALRQAGEPSIDILSANADGSLTLAAALIEGEEITWAMRQPLAAEAEMRQSLNAAVDLEKAPDFGLMFSCIGRGPLFYGNDDRDLIAFRETFPGTPLLGAYGSGQIAPGGSKNRLFHNAVVTLLFESEHV